MPELILYPRNPHSPNFILYPRIRRSATAEIYQCGALAPRIIAVDLRVISEIQAFRKSLPDPAVSICIFQNQLRRHIVSCIRTRLTFSRAGLLIFTPICRAGLVMVALICRAGLVMTFDRFALP